MDRSLQIKNNSMIIKIIDFILYLINKYYYFIGKYAEKDTIMFVPHSGMCRIDLYDIINYKSDSALSFLRYILDKNLQEDKKLLVACRDDADLSVYQSFIHDNYPNRIVSFTPIFANKQYSKKEKFKRHVQYCKNITKCSHVFTSITQDFSGLVSNQVLVDLNYFTCAMKNDILDPDSPYYMGVENIGHEYKYIVGTSEFAIRLIMPEMSLPYKRYVNLGLCRNDNVLNGDKCVWLRKEIQDKVSYTIKKIVLYTPTHRDYESKLSEKYKRSVLGFNFDSNSFGNFLKNEGIVFICKLHPKQNALVIESELPEGLILHKPDYRYGLTELMQVSDALVTDYTSVYFDYLLLDKPIIFNFYDLEIYKRERGVPCDPLSAISAGEIVKNEEQMKRALCNLDRNAEEYRQMRSFVRNLFFTNQDANSCQRVYNLIWRQNENS